MDSKDIASADLAVAYRDLVIEDMGAELAEMRDDLRAYRELALVAMERLAGQSTMIDDLKRRVRDLMQALRNRRSAAA